jgi:4-amino-4-deoxy-L-arabinose transferase-like glycosyltransferase
VSVSPTITNDQRTTAPRAQILWRSAQAQGTALVLWGILLAGAAVRLWMLAHGVPALDSDEATIGLMALHMQHGELAVFMWGQQYMGSLEAILIAPFLWLFGASPVTLRLAPMLLGLAGVATTYQLGARLYNRRAGLMSATLLALGPPFFVVLSVRAYGGYVETLLFGNLLLLLALRGADPARRTRPAVFWLGLLAGVALWTNLLALPYLLAVALLCWLQRRSDLLRRNALSLFGGLLLGASPAILYNVFNGAGTVETILGLTIVGAHNAHASAVPLPLTLMQNLWHEITIALPILTGGFLGGTQAAGFKESDYLAQAAVHPVLYAIALLIGLVALALFLRAALRLLRGWRTLRSPSTTDSSTTPLDNTLVRRQGRAALAFVAACYFVAFFLGRQPDIAATPRYLFPLFAALPLLVAELLALLDGLARKLATSGWLTRLPGAARSERHVKMALLALVLLPLCAWNLAGDVAVTPLQTAARDHNIWVAGQDQQLLQTLAAHHVHTVISNDYWEGMRLTFESNETIITVMMTPQGHPGFNRYRPYIARGLADPRPAYLELTGTPEAALALGRLHNGQLPGYTVQIIGSFTVVLPS